MFELAVLFLKILSITMDIGNDFLSLHIPWKFKENILTKK